MNKKALILLVLIALVVYYLNHEEPKSKKSLLSNEPWIIPPKPQAKKEPTIKFPSDEIPQKLLSTEEDYSWLTDDNLEYILKNWEPLQKALKAQNKTQNKFHLRTDIANIYNCFYKAKTNQDWDLPEFLERMEDNKAQYTLFPLRVNGNHWGLVILEEIKEVEPEPEYEPGVIYAPSARWVKLVTKVYYTSSGGVGLDQEKQQLQPFIEQIVGENTPITIIPPKDRNSKGYECGVYLCFYVREILERGELKLERSYTEKDCQEFRKEWKERIGESWGKWD